MSASVSVSFKKPVQVLMLGWEYPPRFAGGLGKACSGLSQAMASLGCQITFVLPTFPKRIVESHLRVVGARELLVESGWPKELQIHSHVQREAVQSPGNIVRIETEAKLFPYGKHPTGELPPSVLRMLGETFERVTKKLGVERQTFQKEWASTEPEPYVPPLPNPRKEEKEEIYGSNMWEEIERYCFAVRQLGKSHEVDVVHAHDWMSFPAALEYKRMNPRAPVFMHVHATEYDRSGENVNTDVFRVEREGFRAATHIFAVSRYTAGIIEKLYGIPREKITVVYNAPDEGAKQMISSPKAQRSPHVVFLGRLTFQKGPDHFLEAAKMVIDAAPKRLGKVQFIFCGTGDMLDKLRSQAFRLGIEDRVHFAGFVEPRHVDQILMKSRVLVMPSVSEPFGLVALEAIHCGIPVILSKQSGVREVLHRALQVDFWDHEKLADQILAALRLKELSRQLVDEGMEQIRALSWEKSAHTVINSYRRYL
ncbi:MAG: glycosyltransferase [Bdellovibrionota bacterium]